MEDIQPHFQDDQVASAVSAPDPEYEQTQPPINEIKNEDLQGQVSQSYVDTQPSGTEETDQPMGQLQQQTQPTEVVNQEHAKALVKSESPPVSEYESVQVHLTQNRYDASAWNKLVDLAEQSGDLSKIKQAYESLLQAYPNTVRFFFLYAVCICVLSDSCGCELGASCFVCLKAEAQIAYLEHYLSPGLFPNAEALFNRFLRPSPSVRLWKFYLTYVR